MPATYDEQGNYLYPDGFDPESGDWLPGFESQREEWERQYAEARARFEAHRKQIEESRAKAEEEGETVGETAATSQSAPRPRGGSRPAGPENNAPHRHPGFGRGASRAPREAVWRPELRVLQRVIRNGCGRCPVAPRARGTAGRRRFCGDHCAGT